VPAEANPWGVTAAPAAPLTIPAATDLWGAPGEAAPTEEPGLVLPSPADLWGAAATKEKD